jgi:hypothetical protein
MNSYESKTLNWKNEQIIIFKKYIKNFKPGTVEYIKLAQGIKDLENINY